MLASSLSILALFAVGASATPAERDDRLKRALSQKLSYPGWTWLNCFNYPIANAGHSVDSVAIPFVYPPDGSKNGVWCLEYAQAHGYNTAWFGTHGLLDMDVGLTMGPVACSTLCQNNPTKQCGGYFTGDLYLYTAPPVTTSQVPSASISALPADEPTSSPSTTSSSTTSASSSSTASVSSLTSEPAAPAAPTPTFLSSYKTSGKKGKTFKRKGCYSDLMYGTRALPNLLAQPVNHTVEGCLEACATGKFSLCGVEYHGECWGANKLDSTSQPLDDSACELTCSDDPTEYCGGTGGPAGASFQLFSSA
ncbi:hypothetical protein JCM8097_006419 [Rhodosporidiobolus ruineniae]